MKTPTRLTLAGLGTGALVARMNFALVLSSDRLPGTRTDRSLLLGEQAPQAHNVSLTQGANGSGSAAEEQRLEKILLGTPASERTRRAVLTQSEDSSVPRQAEHDFLSEGDETAPASASARPSPDRQAAVMTGLLLGSPEFQRR